MKSILPLLISVLILAGCKKEVIATNASSLAQTSVFSPLSAAGTIAITEHSAEPEATDPAIKTLTVGDPLQYAYVPVAAADRKDVLYIFIPGTFSIPSSYNEVCEAAAQAGYYSIAIAYSNRNSVEGYAGRKTNDSTVKNILEEFLTGNNVSPKVTVSRANSFENRIIKMISYLDAQYPAENWSRFLTSDKNIRWEKLSVAGHSQGSDHAMYMSKVRGLYRAGFIGGPGSFLLPNGSYPTFMQQPGLTPASSLYGFNHLKDHVRRWNDVKVTWNVLGLPGSPNSVDDNDFDGSHRLTTSADLRDTHSGTIQDDATPVDNNGNPVYAPVWSYMNFPE